MSKHNCITIEITQEALDSIQSSEEVILEKYFKRHSDVPLVSECPEHHVEQVHDTNTPSSNGPKPKEYLYFVSLNFPRDHKVRLNKKINKRWDEYNSNEQRIILSRITHLLCEDYYIVFELCRDYTLHNHIICKSQHAIPRDFEIEIKRFYGVNSKSFANVQLCRNQDSAEPILFNKDINIYDQLPPKLLSYLKKDAKGDKAYSICDIPVLRG